MRERVGGVLYEMEKRHEGKGILFVTHGYPAAALMAAAEGANRAAAVNILDNRGLEPAEIAPLLFTPLPHDEKYELDFHRPYIDEIVLVAPDGTRLERVHDVFDCWFESGSMPYAQDHYPFEHRDRFDPKPGFFRKARGYPADFIAEGLDQTRGWFYSLIVLGTALFGHAPYKNVIVNGIILAEDGQKMSKRLKNYPDPLEVVGRHGADALRYYLLASPLMRAEDLNFSEKGVAEIASKLIGRLMNVVSFYEMYAGDEDAEGGASSNVLDRWIMSRLSQTTLDIEKAMDVYELDRASRPLMDFVEDLSTWYLRRSRDRFKAGGADAAAALRTTRVILKSFAILAAPFIPFAAESVFQKVRGNTDPESVHLASWPEASTADEKLIANMRAVREVVSVGLEKRQKAGIKVRQPLARAETKSAVAASSPYVELVRDELNVKQVVSNPGLEELITLDTVLTDELRDEGELRDLIREVQDLRKHAGLNPKDKAVLLVPPDKKAFVLKHRDVLTLAANLARIENAEVFNVTRAPL